MLERGDGRYRGVVDVDPGPHACTVSDDREAALVDEIDESVRGARPVKLLKTAGLVVDRAEGTRRIYRVDPEGSRELRQQLDRFWNEALVNFKQLVDQPEEDT